MNILEETATLVTGLGLPFETGVFSDTAPDTYCVLTPLGDTYEFYADNIPGFETQELRISLYSKHNYLQTKKALESALLRTGFTVTQRLYVAHEDITGYHHIAIDVAKIYPLED